MRWHIPPQSTLICPRYAGQQSRSGNSSQLRTPTVCMGTACPAPFPSVSVSLGDAPSSRGKGRGGGGQSIHSSCKHWLTPHQAWLDWDSGMSHNCGGVQGSHQPLPLWLPHDLIPLIPAAFTQPPGLSESHAQGVFEGLLRVPASTTTFLSPTEVFSMAVSTED